MFEGVKIFGPTGMPYIDETIAAEENDPKAVTAYVSTEFNTDWSLDSEPLLASPPYTPPNTQLNILSYPVGRVKPFTIKTTIMRHKILIVSAVALFTLSSCGEDFLYNIEC